MSTTANYASTPKIGLAQVSSANTALDGTGTLATVFTAGASGSVLYSVAIKATMSTTDGMVRLFISDGTNHRLFTEVPIPSNAQSFSNPTYETVVDMYSTAFPATYSLRASTQNAETFNVVAFYGDL